VNDQFEYDNNYSVNVTGYVLAEKGDVLTIDGYSLNTCIAGKSPKLEWNASFDSILAWGDIKAFFICPGEMFDAAESTNAGDLGISSQRKVLPLVSDPALDVVCGPKQINERMGRHAVKIGAQQHTDCE
jgi:hypothetical protein